MEISFKKFLLEGKEENVKGDKAEFQKFFKKKLKKFGVNEPDELSDEDKKKFFDEVDAEWKADNESDPDEMMKEIMDAGIRDDEDDVKDNIEEAVLNMNDTNDQSMQGLAKILNALENADEVFETVNIDRRNMSIMIKDNGKIFNVYCRNDNDTY